MQKDNPILEAKNIGIEFTLPTGEPHRVLEDVNLSLMPNEVVAIIGPSGCGKSTLMRILAGLIPPTRGEIYYHGKIHHGLIPEMTMVFQNFALFPWMTVLENVEMALKAIHAPPEEIENKSRQAIEMIGLTDFVDAYPREISGGMKQRVGIARALVRNPETLFMDEPFSSLDAFSAETLRSEIMDIWANKALALQSILLVSHDVQEVTYMADRIMIFGANPGTVRDVRENKLPRPRDYHSPDFQKMADSLHESYNQIALQKKEAPPPVQKVRTVLFGHIHPDEIVGLLKYLAHRGGSQDIYKIGSESRIHFDQIAIILQAAELLDFVEIVERTVTLSRLGKQYLAAPIKERRVFWRKQLLRIPLFQRIYTLLQDAPEHAMSRNQVVYLISQEFPFQNVDAHFQILVRWGHHGHLFTYHKLTKKLTLNKDILSK